MYVFVYFILFYQCTNHIFTGFKIECSFIDGSITFSHDTSTNTNEERGTKQGKDSEGDNSSRGGMMSGAQDTLRLKLRYVFSLVLIYFTNIHLLLTTI